MDFCLFSEAQLHFTTTIQSALTRPCCEGALLFWRCLLFFLGLNLFYHRERTFLYDFINHAGRCSITVFTVVYGTITTLQVGIEYLEFLV